MPRIVSSYTTIISYHLAKKLKKYLKGFDIQVCFKPCNRLEEKLLHFEDRQDKTEWLWHQISGITHQ